MIEAQDKDYIMCASTYAETDEEEEQIKKKGLLGNHSYSILKVANILDEYNLTF